MAQEKIRIQILDIVEDPLRSNLVDLHLGTATSTKLYFFLPPLWNTNMYQYVVPFTGPIVPGMANDAPHYFEYILQTPLVTGVEYILSFETQWMQPVNGVTFDGFMGFDTLGGVSANAKRSTDGTYVETFIATGPEVRLYSDNTTTFNTYVPGEIAYSSTMIAVSIREKNLDIDKNVVGELDITDSQDFPLAMSYAVSDGKNLEQRFGDYSKSFDVPATDNNNKLFAHRYDVKMTDKKDMAGMKPCRILVGDTEFFRGLIQLGGVTQTSSPDSYTCTIYGGNFGWISQLKNFNLCDIYDKEDFEYTYTKIWAAKNNTQANSDLCYPLISYGDFWPNWGAGLYGAGYVNLVDATDSSQDWRPSFWVYNMIEKIFDNIGYSIESNFINTTGFKQLISHFPPTGLITSTSGSMFATRKEWNQSNPSIPNVGIWDASIPAAQKDYQIVRASNWVTGVAGGDLGDSSWQDIILDEVIDDPDGCYNPTTGYWTCQKAGRYNAAAVVHLLVGNFDNSQAATGVVASGNSNGSHVKNVEVGIRVRLSDGSGNTMVSAFDNFGTSQTRIPFKMQWGKYTTQASSPAPYTSTAIPVLMAVEKEMQNPYAWWIPTGWQLNVQVQVRFHFTTGGTSTGNVNEGNAKLGYICLSDENRTSLTGQNGVHFFNGDSYYSNVCQGFIGNTGSSWNVGAVRQIWSQHAKPYFKVEPIANEGFNHGETYLIRNCLPCDISQTNFLKGIAHMFNLQFRTDAQERKVYIEPFDDFFGEKKDAYNWDGKVDYSKEIKDTFDIGLYEEMSWEYKNDGSDGLMKFVNESFRDADSAYHFFNHREEIGDNFRKGTNKSVNPVFASTWMDWNADSSGQGGVHPMLMPVINKTHSIYGYGVQGLPTRPDKIIKYLPRIMKFKGHVQSPNVANFMTTWVYQDGSGPHGASSSPRAVFVDWEDTSINLMDNLSFADEIINPPMTATLQYSAGLYTLYWRNMIEQYKANPRIRTYHVKLDMSDMITINLRRLAYIDGSYWRINKIIDFAPAKNELTKVEFIQWTEQVPLEKRTSQASSF